MVRITKFGQCCLLLEIDGKRILTDPGAYSTAQTELRNLDLILITHEHGDHLHTDSLAEILQNNPNATVVTNSSVGAILKKLGLEYKVVEGDARGNIVDLTIAAHDGPHAEIFEEFGQVQNTGYFIADTLFYPGDAYTNPNKPVPILALPVGGPWCRIADSIHYALEVAPETAFPVHDVFLTDQGLVLTHGLVQAQLKERGIEFYPLKNDQTLEL